MALLKHRQPLISYAELSSSLPASRSLWLAPTAEAWRLAYTAESLNDHRSSLRDLLKDGRSLSSISTAIDKHIARSAYLHGMAAQIWEFSQQAMLLGESSDRSSQLWLQLRQENLYVTIIQHDYSVCSSYVPGISNCSEWTALLTRLSQVLVCCISFCRCMFMLTWKRSHASPAGVAKRKHIEHIRIFNHGV
jgi:hypothetical protein